MYPVIGVFVLIIATVCLWPLLCKGSYTTENKKDRNPHLIFTVSLLAIYVVPVHLSYAQTITQSTRVESFEVLIPSPGIGETDVAAFENQTLEMYVFLPEESPKKVDITPPTSETDLTVSENKPSAIKENASRSRQMYIFTPEGSRKIDITLPTSEVGSTASKENTSIIEKNDSRSPKWTHSISTWVSTGQTDWNHTSRGILFGDPTSELIYQDLLGFTGEFQSKVDWGGHWFARLLAGYGAGSGELIDDDFVSTVGATFFATSVAGPHRISRTLSDVDLDEILYGQLDLGGYFYQSAHVKLGAYFGYQYWTEENVGKGFTQLECTSAMFCLSPGTVAFTGQRVITNTVQWHSIRLGLNALFQITNKLDLELDAAFIPLTYAIDEDIHHLRADLAQSPSIEHTGRGEGYNLEGTLRYNIFLPGLYLKASYRFWQLEVKDSRTLFFRSDGSSGQAILNRLRSYRHGGTIGLEYRF